MTENNMTISAKVLNDEIKKISETNSLLDMLCEFERILDDVDLYAFKNWNKGEVLAGPKLDRHFINVSLMYPYKNMPDPDGAKRLINKECLVKFRKDTLIRPKKIRTIDDVVIEARPDGGQKYKAKTKSEPVWVVEIKMPRRYVDEFSPEKIQADEDAYVDMQDIDSAADMTNNQAVDPATAPAVPGPEAGTI